MGETADLVLPVNVAESKRANYRARRGQITQVRRGLYVESTDEGVVEASVLARWMDIVRAFCPTGTILAYRTARELAPVESQVFVVSPVRNARSVKIGDILTINILPGDVTRGVEPVIPGLGRSGAARICLENLSQSSGRRSGVNKALGREWVEEYLSRSLLRGGEAELNALRDEARTLATTLQMQREYGLLAGIVQALLASHPDVTGVLSSELAIATASGEPFDVARLDLFRELADYLARCDLDAVSLQYASAAWRNVSFFEAYFSNYIEGTEFTVEEAEMIVFEREVNADRRRDSHDVLGTYDLVSDRQEMLQTPRDVDELLELIKSRHERMLHARPEVRPGEFKQQANRAGSTQFVAPQELVGTLARSLPIYLDLAPGLARAIFIQFVISECHPMDDGNGRLSRLFLNAELHNCALAKLIVPTVHRESYLLGLRVASRSRQFRTMVKVLHQMHLYCSSLPWADYGELLDTLREHRADREPDEGVGVFNRVISEWRRDYPVG